MWESRVQSFNSGKVLQISLWRHSRKLTFSEVVALWQTHGNFRSVYSAVLAESPFSAFFWEMPPVTRSSIDTPYEFVLVDSPSLSQISPDATPFAEQFDRCVGEEVISFPNLGNDALLVVPTPGGDTSSYPHLAAFVRHAPDSQKQSLWQSLGEAIALVLDDRPLWISTSGLGVHWLHVRLDSRPKYYTFAPYKVFDRS